MEWLTRGIQTYLRSYALLNGFIELSLIEVLEVYSYRGAPMTCSYTIWYHNNILNDKR